VGHKWCSTCGTATHSGHAQRPRTAATHSGHAQRPRTAATHSGHAQRTRTAHGAESPQMRSAARSYKGRGSNRLPSKGPSKRIREGQSAPIQSSIKAH
jgi:hypothetical protein